MSYASKDRRDFIGVLTWATPAAKHSELTGAVFDAIGFDTYNAYVNGIHAGETSLPTTFRRVIENEQ